MYLNGTYFYLGFRLYASLSITNVLQYFLKFRTITIFLIIMVSMILFLSIVQRKWVKNNSMYFVFASGLITYFMAQPMVWPGQLPFLIPFLLIFEIRYPRRGLLVLRYFLLVVIIQVGRQFNLIYDVQGEGLAGTISALLFLVPGIVFFMITLNIAGREKVKLVEAIATPR
jgi:hypothetical protein